MSGPTLIEHAVARLTAEVPALGNRVRQIAEFADLVHQGKLPETLPAAFVLPLGFRAEPAIDVTGEHRQELRRVVGVVLIARDAGDGTGGRVLPTIDRLEAAALRALMGWQPPGWRVPFSAGRGVLLGQAAGTVIAQVEFTISEFVRVFPAATAEDRA